MSVREPIDQLRLCRTRIEIDGHGQIHFVSSQSIVYLQHFSTHRDE